MADCCDSTQNSPAKLAEANRRHRCPVSNNECQQVPFTTVLQHIKKPWKVNLIVQQYYFCSDPDCEVVYVGENDNVINHVGLREAMATKASSDDNALICYCFDISVAEARKDRRLEEFVTEKTKNKHCACEIQNPSGKCCLKDFKQLNR